MHHPPVTLSLSLLVGVTAPCFAQEMQWEDYEPRSTLVVPENPRTASRFPFVDAHAHTSARLTPEGVDSLVRVMDDMNMAVMVNLSGRSGEQLQQIITNLKGRHPTRFVVFANLNFADIDDPDWGERAAHHLAEDVRAGASGLKIFKNLGMTVRDGNGKRISTDDPRFDPVWAKAGELGIPVLIHTGDPHQFWEPQDQYNERWFELKERPRRIRLPEQFPPWETIMQEQWNVIRKHPETTFISAHLSWLGGDLARLGTLLDEMPNMYTAIGAVLGELGRQPHTGRRWFERYQDRVLFGKDAWEATEYHVYFRTLETNDEYFDYYRKRHAFWKLYGMELPDSILQKVYYGNALRIIPGIDPLLFPGPADPMPIDRMAHRIAASLAPVERDRAILRYDPLTLPSLAPAVANALLSAGADVEFMPYGEVPDFQARLATANIYVWLPGGPDAATTTAQAAALGRWLDEGHGRQIHFHWGSGTVDVDGLSGVHSPSYDAIYAAALDIDYSDLDRRQREAIDLLRSGEVRVTTPAGTDLRFRLGDRPVNQQNGDASPDRARDARSRIDREIELPAGVIRVAPVEHSVNGVLVVPRMRIGAEEVVSLRLHITEGTVTDVTAGQGVEHVHRLMEEFPATRFFREFGLGFNPRLTRPQHEPWLPYYGYGAGVVRLSLGNNSELGGEVRGSGVRWLFFPDATVTVGGATLVREGRLVDGP